MEMRFGTNLCVLYGLELSLLFFQKLNVIDVHLIVDSVLLILYVIVHSSIPLECAFHTLHNSCLRVHAILIELPPVVLFRVMQEIRMVPLFRESIGFLVVHFRNKLLPTLQVLDALLGLVLLSFELDDSVLDLRLLVLLLLGGHDCFHHHIISLLISYRAHS